MRQRLLVLLIMCLCAVACPSQPANTRRACTTWIDPVLHVQFPERLAHLRLTARSAYSADDWDYSLRYETEAAHCDLYVFTRDGQPFCGDMADAVTDELEATVDGIVALCPKAKELDLIMEGRLPETGVDYQWTALVVQFPRSADSYRSAAVLMAWRDRFIKIRYSEPLATSDEEPWRELPASLRAVLDALDALFASAEEASLIDVYALKDPVQARAALQRKWLGGDYRKPMSEWPSWAQALTDVNFSLRWWRGNNTSDAVAFEKIARDGIEQRLEPDTWFYNLACALGRQGRRAEMLEALEQAVVAGFRDAAHMDKDPDLDILRDDSRYARLQEMARLNTTDLNRPKKPAKVNGSVLQLVEDNFFYDFRKGMYVVEVETDQSDPLFMVDHNAKHADVEWPEGVIAVSFPPEMHDTQQDSGAANVCFRDVRTGVHLPTIVYSSSIFGTNRTVRLESIPGRLGVSTSLSRSAAQLLSANALGVYGADFDYGQDGLDRLVGYYPGSLNYLPTADAPAGKFERLCVDVWRRLSPAARKGGLETVLNLIRRSQACVTNETDFLSGQAQRPALAYTTIDLEKLRKEAEALQAPLPSMPEFRSVRVAQDYPPAIGLTPDLYRRPEQAKSPHHAVFCAGWRDRTGTLSVALQNPPAGTRYEWRVLQGDAQKVRVKVRAEDPTQFDVEVDYHAVFTVDLPDGRRLKTSRVDLGCFAVAAGKASLPAVVSVFFSPAETREYFANGLLKSVDYTRPQLAEWSPLYCARGAWKDEYFWWPTRELMGVRTVTEGVGVQNYSPDGYLIVREDDLGRPLDVVRDLSGEWVQLMMHPSVTGEAWDDTAQRMSDAYDRQVESPDRITLAWRYTYAGPEDRRGRVDPLPHGRYRPRPDLFPRADFAEDSGFAVPLRAQLRMGWIRYESYKYGVLDPEFTRDAVRDDTATALKAEGKLPPEKLAKMRFCPWKASTNDVWRLDMDDYEARTAPLLIEQSDGVYRMEKPSQDEEGSLTLCSVYETYQAQQWIADGYAFDKLDAAYARCEAQTMKTVLEGSGVFEDWEKVFPVARGQLHSAPWTDAHEAAAALWQVTPTVYLLASVSRTDAACGDRVTRYAFLTTDPATQRVRTYDEMMDLPSRAMGNMLLQAIDGVPAALNNLAVLYYAGLVNPDACDLDEVEVLLQRAASKGNATAIRNLGVLRENCCEPGKARHYYDLYRRRSGTASGER